MTPEMLAATVFSLIAIFIFGYALLSLAVRLTAGASDGAESEGGRPLPGCYNHETGEYDHDWSDPELRYKVRGPKFDHETERLAVTLQYKEAEFCKECFDSKWTDAGETTYLFEPDDIVENVEDA